MIRRPPRSTLFPLHDALPISLSDEGRGGPQAWSTWGFTDEDGRGAGCFSPWDSRDRPGGASSSCTPSGPRTVDRKSTRLNSSHANISYAVFCLKKKKNQ